jgi:hypothetical protein
MFTAYIDDSNMTAKPVAMLGGWVGKAQDWISLTDSWAETSTALFQIDGSTEPDWRVWGLDRSLS